MDDRRQLDLIEVLRGIKNELYNLRLDAGTDRIFRDLRQQGNPEQDIRDRLNTLDEYYRLQDAGFHPVQAHTLVRVAAEVSRSTDPDPYGVGMALRKVRGAEEKITYTSEDVLKGVDPRELVHVLVEAVEGRFDSDEWRAEAQKRLAKSLEDDSASEALVRWVRLVGRSVKKRRKAARSAIYHKHATLAAAVLAAVAATAAAVMQAF